MRFVILMMLSASAFADQIGCYQFGNITQCTNGVSAYRFGNITQIVTPYPSTVPPIAPVIVPPVPTPQPVFVPLR